MPKVFISHSTNDRLFIEKDLIPTLDQHGIDTWYSKKDILTAQDWELKIKEGLKECDWFLVVLTENTVKSKWVRREVSWALENREGQVIPLLLRECDPDDVYFGLGGIQNVDFSKDIGAGFKDLLKTWGKTWEKAIRPDPNKESDSAPVTMKKKVLDPKKRVLVSLVILATLLTAIVWVFLLRRNTDIPDRLIKASNSGTDSATIRLANYYYSKGLDSNVIATIQPLALKGDTEALKLLGNSQYNIGFALYNKKEFKQSFEFFNKSVAGNNNARAECMLGIMYYWGQGAIQKDYKQAFEWLVKSSDQNNDYARLWLGLFYMNGYGVIKNNDTASKYFNWVIKNGGKATSDEARKKLAALNQNRKNPEGA